MGVDPKRKMVLDKSQEEAKKEANIQTHKNRRKQMFQRLDLLVPMPLFQNGAYKVSYVAQEEPEHTIPFQFPLEETDILEDRDFPSYDLILDDIDSYGNYYDKNDRELAEIEKMLEDHELTYNEILFQLPDDENEQRLCNALLKAIPANSNPSGLMQTLKMQKSQGLPLDWWRVNADDRREVYNALETLADEDPKWAFLTEPWLMVDEPDESYRVKLAKYQDRYVGGMGERTILADIEFKLLHPWSYYFYDLQTRVEGVIRGLDQYFEQDFRTLVYLGKHISLDNMAKHIYKKRDQYTNQSKLPTFLEECRSQVRMLECVREEFNIIHKTGLGRFETAKANRNSISKYFIIKSYTARVTEVFSEIRIAMNQITSPLDFNEAIDQKINGFLDWITAMVEYDDAELTNTKGPRQIIDVKKWLHSYIPQYSRLVQPICSIKEFTKK